MSRYIRTKDGNYGWIMTKEKRQDLINCARGDYGFCRFDIPVDKEADTIEELVKEGDLVFARDYWERTKKHIHPVIVEQTYLPIQKGSITELYIKEPSGDYKLVAQMNSKGELELL